MPSPTVNRFLVRQADNVFLQQSSIPASAHTWQFGNDLCWAVIPQTGQAAPLSGYVAAYSDPNQPWLGATYSAPPPVYLPLAQLKENALKAITDFADALFSERNGSPRVAQQNFESLNTLSALQSPTPEQASQLASLLDLSARNAATNDRADVLTAWVTASNSQADLTAFLTDVARPLDGLGWPV